MDPITETGLRASIAALQRELVTVRCEREALRSELQAVVEGRQKDHAVMQSANDQLNKEIDQLNLELGAARAKVDRWLQTNDGIHALHEERDALAADVQTLKNAFAGQQAIGDALASEVTNLRAKLQDADHVRQRDRRALARQVSQFLHNVQGELSNLNDMVDSAFGLGGHTWRAVDDAD